MATRCTDLGTGAPQKGNCPLSASAFTITSAGRSLPRQCVL